MNGTATRHVLSRSGISRFALAIGATDEIYHDADYARSQGYRDIVAPPSYYNAIALSLGRELPSSELREDGLAAGDQVAGRVVSGGFSVRWHGALCAGDEVDVVEERLPIRSQASRAGTLTIDPVQRKYFVGGQLAIEERNDRLGIPAGPVVRPRAGEHDADLRELMSAELRLGELDLFMFSAATWLTHRIHFDREYARSEGYEDLVIPGPLQGACLAQLLSGFAGCYGGKLNALEVRHRAPATCGPPLRMSANTLKMEAGSRAISMTLRVQVASPTGLVHTSGSASLTLARSAAVLSFLTEYSAAR
jgi:hydroxyacyl-ACP dehydratase HTD2-like protein with hotdog domain